MLLEALEKIKKKIENPDRWCQGFYAKDAEGRDVGSMDPKACRWCLMGAMNVVVGWDTSVRTKIINLLQEHLKGAITIALFNDTKTHAEVMEYLDRVIEGAKNAA